MKAPESRNLTKASAALGHPAEHEFHAQRFSAAIPVPSWGVCFGEEEEDTALNVFFRGGWHLHIYV